MLSRFIQSVKDNQSEIILVLGVVLISLFSFSMGYIVAKFQERQPIQIETNDKPIESLDSKANNE
ncbi:MAG: hypothetical protein US98_C0057G0003 [Parcubacteria group bacterium GW2011_GWC1_38_6]|nr:MAG: hypothetical protein US98_C0057G0003 [Parcubacteria group bacterium GW2011_GWC1_38_6]